MQHVAGLDRYARIQWLTPSPKLLAPTRAAPLSLRREGCCSGGAGYLIRTLRGRHVVFSWLWRGFQFGDTLGQEHDDSVLTAGLLFPALDLLSRYISGATPVHQKYTSAGK